MKNVYEIITNAAKTWPHAIATVDQTGSLTYTELANETEQLKKELLAQGLTPGQGLGVMMRNSNAFIVGVFAGLGCGATVMPLSNQLKQAEFDDIQKEMSLHFVLDDQNGPKPTGTEKPILKERTKTLRLTQTSNNSNHPMNPGIDAAFARFTSGTTGKSKGVAISHQAVLERTSAAQKGLALTQKDVIIWVLPMAYHFIVSIVLYIRYGVKIATTKDVLAQNILQCINEHKGTLLYAAPMHYKLLAADKSTLQTPSLQRAISTSSAISINITKAYETRYGLPVSQAYGIIEVGLPIINLDHAASHPGAIGKALPDYEVAIINEQGTTLPPEETGQLAIKGPGMFDAYLSPLTHRKDIERQGWFLTGDLATMTQEGIITVVGRQKSMINVAGNKVFPEEVEHVLEQHPAIANAKVKGVNHPMMGETVKADIVLIKGQTVETEDILKFCRQRLSSYKIPQYVEPVTSIPQTNSGKTAR